MDNWRFLDTGSHNGAMNMAIDEALMIHSRKNNSPVIRIYRWDPAALSLGFFQKARREISVEACHKEGVDIVRRPTGGRAVLHDRELTYSLAVPAEHPTMPRTVTDSYRKIALALLAGFNFLGIPAELSGKTAIRRKDFRSPACFEAPSSYEIVVEGKKIVGSAQMRKDGMILQHGSIINDLDADRLFRLWGIEDTRTMEKAKKLFLDKATSIKEVTGSEISWEKLADSFYRGFSQELCPRLFHDKLTEEESATAAKLFKEKYSLDTWNFRK